MATRKHRRRGWGFSLPSARRHRETNLIQYQRLHLDLLFKAIDDPDLVAVMDTYGGAVPADTQRQYLMANALYTNMLLAYRVGSVTRKELFGHMRLFFQNSVCREFWLATAPQRASLDPDSEEYSIGRMMDQLLQDLDEASDNEDWWVVGTPPES
ncbi:DUF6082 family protein [Streptomyces sp. NPDC060194]|uniref:DUF6082 family protein n=1 Tax=Streptomyces sp. NPDC060194 TaxID=3347069 RepID=UPI00365ECBD5